MQDRTAYLTTAGSRAGTILNIVYLMLALALVIALLSIGNILALAGAPGGPDGPARRAGHRVARAHEPVPAVPARRPDPGLLSRH